ncbi:MAG: chromosomal replication initiator protein DnaA [Desulfotomaculales bacterium]
MVSSELLNVWQNLTRNLERKISPHSYETWLKAMKPVALHHNTLVIEVPHHFSKDWLSNRYQSILQQMLQQLLSQQIQLRFVVPEEVPDILLQLARGGGLTPDRHSQSQLNPRYTFDTFVVGNSNRFAHAASRAVAEAPARAYNPLFIYGGVGLGKTHLMHAIGHFVLLNHRNLRVTYVTSEKFTNDLINAIRDDKTVEFRSRYRSIDVLLVDDIQFLAGKERTQEEFFHTFNTLHEANKQIIISSDRPPKDIPTLEDRLRSRFEWGLITDIQAPDFETRVAILKKKAHLDSVEVPDEIITYIADRIQSNIRELEGALIRVIAYASLTNRQPTLDLAMELLDDILPPPKPRQITVSLIQEVVAHHYGLHPDELRAKKRTRAVAFPRQVAMYLARELTELSLPQIGEEFGGRDHTTVLHAFHKIAQERMASPELNHTLEELKRRLTTHYPT